MTEPTALAPMPLAPASLAPGATPPLRRRYWEAQGLAELVLSEFGAAVERQDEAGQRRAFYRLAGYHGRTHRILRTALEGGRSALATAALRNLVALHRPLTYM